MADRLSVVSQNSEGRADHAAASFAADPQASIAGVMALQTAIGNRAVARAIQAGRVGAGGTVRPAARVLARSTGLRRSKRVSEFANDALAYWRDAANKGKPLDDYATHLMTRVNAMLKTLNSFEAKYVIDYGGSDSGTFSRVTWTISINPDKFSSRPNVTKVGDLTADEAAEIADTIYHESRHSEQYFRIARVQAGRIKKGTKNPGAKIAKDMSIPRDVADAAAAAPLTAAPGNEELLAEADEWESITVGRHGEYKGIINVWGDEADELDDEVAGVTAATVESVKATVETSLSNLKSDKERLKFVKGHLSKTKKLKHKTAFDDRVVTHLTTIQEKLEALITAATAALKKWDKADAPTRLQRLKGLRPFTSALRRALYAAYKAHIHEKDAWAAGGAVGKQFRSEQAKKVAAEKARKKKRRAKRKAAKEKKAADAAAAALAAAVAAKTLPAAPVLADSVALPVVGDASDAQDPPSVAELPVTVPADSTPAAVAVTLAEIFGEVPDLEEADEPVKEPV